MFVVSAIPTAELPFPDMNQTRKPFISKGLFASRRPVGAGTADRPVADQ